MMQYQLHNCGQSSGISYTYTALRMNIQRPLHKNEDQKDNTSSLSLAELLTAPNYFLAMLSSIERVAPLRQGGTGQSPNAFRVEHSQNKDHIRMH